MDKKHIVVTEKVRDYLITHRRLHGFKNVNDYIAFLIGLGDNR